MPSQELRHRWPRSDQPTVSPRRRRCRPQLSLLPRLPKHVRLHHRVLRHHPGPVQCALEFLTPCVTPFDSQRGPVATCVAALPWPVKDDWRVPDETLVRLKGFQTSTLIVPRETAQKVVNFFSGGLRQTRRRPPLRVRSKNAAAHQDIFAYRKADPGLLLVTDQRKVRIKKVMSSVAPSGRGMADQVHQHVGEAVASHCSVGAALHLKVQKHTAIATENGDVAHRTLTLEGAQS